MFRRTRILTSPYLYLPGYRLPGFLPSPTHRHRFYFILVALQVIMKTSDVIRCRVRFQEPVLSWRQRDLQVPLEEDLSAQLEGIRSVYSKTVEL